MRHTILNPILFIGLASILVPVEARAVNPDMQPLLSDSGMAVLEVAKKTGGKEFKYPVRVVLYLRDSATTSEFAGFEPVDREDLANQRVAEIKESVTERVKSNKYRVSKAATFPRVDGPSGFWVWVDCDEAKLLKPVVDAVTETQTCVEYIDIEEASVQTTGRFDVSSPDPIGPSLRRITVEKGGDSLEMARFLVGEQKAKRLQIVSFARNEAIIRCNGDALAQLTEKVELMRGVRMQRVELDPTAPNALKLSEWRVTHRNAETTAEILKLVGKNGFDLPLSKTPNPKSNYIAVRMSRTVRDALRKKGFVVDKF